jgi:hypothetical protein
MSLALEFGYMGTSFCLGALRIDSAFEILRMNEEQQNEASEHSRDVLSTS